MDFLSPKKKRAQRMRLALGYSLMAIALTVSTLILVFAANGFDIDRKTGQIIQNGLIIVDSKPVSADIFIDGQHNGRTSERLVLPAGSYNLELRQNGYRNWQHTVQLEGTSIEQIVYPFLFPENLATRAVADFKNQKLSVSQSPDRRWLLIPLEETAKFQLYDLNNETNQATNLELPRDVYTAATGAHVFTVTEWSTDNAHVLLKHTWNKGSEYIMLDRGRLLNSFNVTKLFPDIDVVEASLRDKNPNQFYFLDSKHTLRRANRGDAGADTIATNVADFKPYQSNVVIYADRPTDKKDKVAQIRVWDNERDNLLREVPTSATYFLDIANFNGSDFLVAGGAQDGRAYIYQNSLDDFKASRLPQATRVLIVNKAQHVSFSANARFIALQGGSSFAVYDAETARQHSYNTGLKLSATQPATWMDGHRLVVINDNKANVFDFDGTNRVVLTDSSPNLMPAFDPDYEVLFTLSQSSKKIELLRTELRVK